MATSKYTKHLIGLIAIMLFSLTMVAQRLVLPGQNQIYRFIEDPAFIAANERYNVTGILQASDSDIAQTSQYIAAQLAFFDNVVFGVDYSKHSYDVMRYSQLFLSSRVRLGLGDYYQYFNIGLSLGTDKLNEVDSSRENDVNTIYRVSGHYRNYNLTIGGFLNHIPVQNSLILAPPETLSVSQGYSVFASYDIALSDFLRVTPLARYNSYDDIDFFESVAIMNYKEKGELAISYKNDYSVNAAISAKFLERVKVSYSYEKAIGVQNFNDVHAIGISVDLAPEATELPEWLVNVRRNRIKIHNINYKDEEKLLETIANEEVEETVSDSLPQVEAVDPELIAYPKMSEEDPEDVVDGHLKPGYYVILGSFKNINNAEKAVAKLKSEGYYARYGKKDTDDDFHYVYVDRYTDRDIASKRTIAKQKEKGFEKVWLMRVK